MRIQIVQFDNLSPCNPFMQMSRDTARSESSSGGSHDGAIVARVNGDERESVMRGKAFLFDDEVASSSNGASLRGVLEIEIEYCGRYLIVINLLLGMRLETGYELLIEMLIFKYFERKFSRFLEMMFLSIRGKLWVK